MAGKVSKKKSLKGTGNKRRRAKKSEENRSLKYSLSLKESERERLDREADASGLSLADYIRMKLFDDDHKNNANQLFNLEQQAEFALIILHAVYIVLVRLGGTLPNPDLQRGDYNDFAAKALAAASLFGKPGERIHYKIGKTNKIRQIAREDGKALLEKALSGEELLTATGGIQSPCQLSFSNVAIIIDMIVNKSRYELRVPDRLEENLVIYFDDADETEKKFVIESPKDPEYEESLRHIGCEVVVHGNGDVLNAIPINIWEEIKKSPEIIRRVLDKYPLAGVQSNRPVQPESIPEGGGETPLQTRAETPPGEGQGIDRNNGQEAAENAIPPAQEEPADQSKHPDQESPKYTITTTMNLSERGNSGDGQSPVTPPSPQESADSGQPDNPPSGHLLKIPELHIENGDFLSGCISCGVKYYNKHKNFDYAFKFFLIAAMNNYPRGQYFLAKIFSDRPESAFKIYAYAWALIYETTQPDSDHTEGGEELNYKLNIIKSDLEKGLTKDDIAYATQMGNDWPKSTPWPKGLSLDIEDEMLVEIYPQYLRNLNQLSMEEMLTEIYPPYGKNE